MKKNDDETLKGSRQIWLFSPENLDEPRLSQLELLQQQDLKTSRAWAIKEHFRWFWDYTYAGNAEKFFNRWYDWARRSQLEPIKKAALKLKNHLDRSFKNYRLRILFYCGKLDMLPNGCH